MKPYTALACAATLAAAACALPRADDGTGDDLVAPTDELVTAMDLRFPDLPVPSSFEYRPQRSVVIENPDFRTGQLVYEGTAPIASVAAYYRKEMRRYDWRLISSLERDFVRLSFEKPSATAEVLIEQGGPLGSRTRVTLLYVPRRLASSGGLSAAPAPPSGDGGRIEVDFSSP